MRLFAISDLHLSFGVDKPMDIFGPQWIGHADRIRAAWDEMVGPDDWMLVGGDTSWGLKLEEALPDLQWLGARPGTKILIKGNHCTWWTSRKKVEAVIDPSIRLLQNDAIALPDGTVVVGARMWDPPGAPWAEPNAATVFERELGRLALSIAAGAKLPAQRRLALIHYPPKYSDGRETAVVPMLKEAGVRICVYGHLHGRDCASGFQGEADGIRYLLTSCDAIGFRPVRIEY
jgi:predicted phosphohydrolase